MAAYVRSRCHDLAQECRQNCTICTLKDGWRGRRKVILAATQICARRTCCTAVTRPYAARTPSPRRFLPELGPCQRTALFSSARRRRAASEFLDPRPQLHLPGPGAAVLAVDMEIGGGDGVGVEERIVSRLSPAGVAGLADAAVDDEMADMDVLGRKLAGEALREAAQAELAHGEGCRAGIALDAGGCAGEEDRAVAARQHALRRRLCRKEAAIAADEQGFQHLIGIELANGAGEAAAWIVDHEIRRSALGVERGKERIDLLAAARVAAPGAGARLGDERHQLLGVPRGEIHAHLLLGEEARKRGAQAAAGTDDERSLGHAISPLLAGSSTMA